jgi:hypothetical protein
MNVPPDLVPVFESISHYSGTEADELVREALEDWLSCRGLTLIDRRRQGMFLVSNQSLSRNGSASY